MKIKKIYPMLLSAMTLGAIALTTFNAEEVQAHQVNTLRRVQLDGIDYRDQFNGINVYQMMQQHPDYAYYNGSSNKPIYLFKQMYGGRYTHYTPVGDGYLEKYSSVRYTENIKGNNNKYASTQYKSDYINPNYHGAKWNMNKPYALNLLSHESQHLQGSTNYVSKGNKNLGLVGKNAEFRVLGYSSMGNEITNPFFPLDTLVKGQTIDNYPLVSDPWAQNHPVVGSGSFFDGDSRNPGTAGYNVKRTYIIRLMDQIPQLQVNARNRGGAKNREQVISYLMTHLSMRNDPTTAANDTTEFLGVQNNAGGMFYIGFTLEASKTMDRNLATIKQDVYDVDGKLIRSFTRNADSNKTSQTKQTRKVRSGEQVKVVTTVKNKSNYATSDKVTQFYSSVEGPNSSVVRYDDKDANWTTQAQSASKLGANGTTTVTTNVKIGDKNLQAVRSTIGPKHFSNGENRDVTDDGAINNLAVNNEKGNFIGQTAVLVDKSGKEVQNPTPGEEYKIRYNYLYKGSNASEAMSATLTSKIVRAMPFDGEESKVENISLKNFKPQNGKTYSFTTSSYETYETGIIETVGTLANGISKKDQNYNTNQKDDDVVKSWKGKYDYSVGNVKVVPQAVNSTNPEVLKYLVKFDVDSNVPSYAGNYEKDVTIAVSLDGQKKIAKQHLKKGMNKNVSFEIEVPSEGKDKVLEALVFVNSDKEVYESDYENNSARGTGGIISEGKVTVPKEKPITNQSWEQYFNLKTWENKVVNYPSFNRNLTHTMTKVTPKVERGQLFDLDENYKIKHVWFKSKVTKDRKEGPNKDGWVDLITTVGKIKAGYRYELKIEVEYNTDAFKKMPKEDQKNGSWTRPFLVEANLPTNIYVQTPDKKIHSVNGNGETQATLDGKRVGDRNISQFTYTVRSERDMGVETVGRFLVGKDVSNGFYDINVFTPVVSGVSGKMSSESQDITGRTMRDIKNNLKIKVIGSAADDVQDNIND